MKKIVVTPSGRKRYLEVLYNNLKKCKSEFDTWVLWVNTTDTKDIEYMTELEKKCDWIKLQYSKIPIHSIFSIAHFFEDCVDENSVYIRLDDDIVYIHPNSIKDLFEFRTQNPHPFLVYGNIVNNSIISHIQQKNGNYFTEPKIGYNCMDKNGWLNPQVAEKIHKILLDKIGNKNVESLFFNNYVMGGFERFSINVISWLGSEFKKFGGKVNELEEEWLSSKKPKQLNAPNIIFGKSLFAHYSYFVQKNYLDSTDILSQYLQISIEKLR